MLSKNLPNYSLSARHMVLKIGFYLMHQSLEVLPTTLGLFLKHLIVEVNCVLLPVEVDMINYSKHSEVMPLLRQDLDLVML